MSSFVIENNSTAELSDLKILYSKAVNENLWFYTRINSIDIWMSPKEFGEKYLRNSFWNKQGWILRNPKERIHEIKFTIKTLSDEVESIERELRTN
ncbi:MAG: hypothetical protein IPH62_16375 [Ignavibacteriae bacterium]|nr:hypothetical protein [Ignavibacteriota bacterium]